MFLSGPMSTVQNKGLICYSLKCATEISDSDIILSKKIEDFWEIEHFDSKTDDSPVYKSFCEDICYNSNEARYQVPLPFIDDHEILQDHFTLCKHSLSN